MMDVTPFASNLERAARMIAASIDSSWISARVTIDYVADDASQMELWVLHSPSENEVSTDIDDLITLGREFRSIRKGLVAVGNPKCKHFEFRLAPDGTFDLAVDY